ncbi:MAG: hypothetical protein ACI4MQ_07915 [Candidatus Coproplasma sp.]
MLYSKEDVKSLKKRMWQFVAICIALVVIAVVVGVVTCFFVNDNNAALLKIINMVLSSVCACVALYFLVNNVAPIRARKNYVEKMVNSPHKTIRGRVTGKGKKITSVKHLNLSEIYLNDESGKEILLYWDEDIGEQNLEGHVVEFKVVNNKIVGYGDAL